MENDPQLLILGAEPAPGKPRLSQGLERGRALRAVAAAGAKVKSDDGGRILVIEGTDGSTAKLQRLMPEAQLRTLAPDGDKALDVSSFNESESLFLSALALRASGDYRAQKAERVYGDTPEEQELQSGSCVREEY
jgi:hypothetical protein